MDQDIVTEPKDLVCIPHGLYRLCIHVKYVHNYMAHIKILVLEPNLVLFLYHQSSQCIKKNLYKVLLSHSLELYKITYIILIASQLCSSLHDPQNSCNHE